MQHATERVERPGESQEALDGKKTCSGTFSMAEDPSLRCWGKTEGWSCGKRSCCTRKKISGRCRNDFRAKRPSKTESWNLSSVTSIKNWLKRWKGSFRARHPWTWKMKMQTKLSCEISLKNWFFARCENKVFRPSLPQNCKMKFWKLIFGARSSKPEGRSGKKRCSRARRPWKTESLKSANEIFVPGIILQKLIFKLARRRLKSITLRGRSENGPTLDRRATDLPIRIPRRILLSKYTAFLASATTQISCETSQRRKVEVAKTCETSLKKWSRETSFKNWMLKL